MFTNCKTWFVAIRSQRHWFVLSRCIRVALGYPSDREVAAMRSINNLKGVLIDGAFKSAGLLEEAITIAFVQP
jgi:hypothetical protein